MKITSKKYYAFFDVDGTLIKGKPMLDFLRFYLRKRHRKIPILGEIKYHIFRAKAGFLALIGGSRESQNRLYYKCYKNQDKLFVATMSKEWSKKLMNKESFWSNVVDELNYHKSNGGEIVLVSGSFSACLSMIADKLSLHNILATTLEESNGLYTGNLISEPMIGQGKSHAIRKFLQGRAGVDLSKCFAYGDHVSDMQMLSLVGNPVVIAGDKRLEASAAHNKWRVIYPI
jgi:HAD superfamily hydrolase (TIGR01490 family)